MAKTDAQKIRSSTKPVHRVPTTVGNLLVDDLPDRSTVVHIARAPVRNFAEVSEQWRTSQITPEGDFAFIHPGGSLTGLDDYLWHLRYDLIENVVFFVLDSQLLTPKLERELIEYFEEMYPRLIDPDAGLDSPPMGKHPPKRIPGRLAIKLVLASNTIV